jgi:hypothetical protein
MIVSTMSSRPNRSRYLQRGSATVCALLFATMLGGLAFALIQTGFASGRWHKRADDGLLALEAAETGIARAEQEVSSDTDPGGDGVGTLSGTYAGSRFTVTATGDPLDPERVKLLASGQHGMSRRQVEVCVRMKPTTGWGYGAFGRSSTKIGGSGTLTDSYDSRLGTYASQAVNKDGGGQYARSNGSIGSNGTIQLQGLVHGNANAGPGLTPNLTGGGVVTGNMTPLSAPMDLPATPYADFAAANLVNQNGTWTATGSSVVYNAVTKNLAVSSGGTLTLGAGTYFFSQLSLSGGSTLKVTGPVKIYITQVGSLGGGGIANVTGLPANLQIFQHPYALPVGLAPAKKGMNTLSVSGGSGAALTIYAPYTDVTVSGSGAIYGSIIADNLQAQGGAQFHYDEALGGVAGSGPPKLMRVYWRDVAQPKR